LFKNALGNGQSISDILQAFFGVTSEELAGMVGIFGGNTNVVEEYFKDAVNKSGFEGKYDGV
jgi:hypothetical protein